MRTRPLQVLRDVLSARAVTLTAGLALLSLCVLLLADLAGLRADGTEARREAREAMAESLAVRLSVLVERAGADALDAAIETFVLAEQDVEGAELRRASGGAPRTFGHAETLERPSALVLVPIFDGPRAWGELKVAFRPIDSMREDLRYFGFVTFALLVVYLAYLGKALLQLDPSRAIPERIDSAFNTLVEGVIVLDDRLRVLMANTAAAAILEKRPDELTGSSVERWPWVRDEHWQSPWTTVLNTGIAIVDHPVCLDRAGETASYTLNCSLIRDDTGKPNGVMVTLADLSAVERKNRELSSTLTKLRRSQESIARKNRELEALASQDPLTGLKNRRALVEELDRQLKVVREKGAPLVCLMVDIDHFKQINDAFGHAVGDEVICAVANTLVDQGRKSDTVGRIGGEEFVVVLPDTDIEAGMLIAERIRASIERLAEEVTVPVDKLSASLGVAAHEPAVETLEELLDRADQALYVAKKGGRNRAIRFEMESTSEANDVESEAEKSVTSSARSLELERMLEAKSKDLDTLRTFDPTTGLPRREVFVERVEKGIGEAMRSGSTLALLSLGLRDGERITSTLGPAAASQLMREFARRLSEGFRRADTISEVAGGYGLSHVGATEFGVLLENVSDTAEALAIMTRVRQLFARPIVIDGTRLHVGGSIGAAFYPRDAETAEELIARASKACTEAARQPSGMALKFAGDTAAVPTRESLEMESDLYEAVERRQFSVHYQPKLELASQRITGMEALVRWNHPEKGWISPADFIPLAERNGLIEDISAFVTSTSLEQLATWHRAGFDDVGLAMNISAAQLRNPELAATLLGALESAGVPPERVEVELTETSVIESPQRARIALGQLRSAGVSVSMDDFGVGYTSLALLADLPLDSVKIDRGFVDGMTTNDRSRAIVRSIVDMGRALGLSVVGEGVETNDQLTMLAAFGCNEVQGYLISRPLDAAGMGAFLHQQAREAAPRRRA